MTAANLAEFEDLEIEPLIASAPAEPRDSSRLMVLDRRSGSIEHRTFRDLPGLLNPSDVLVLNRSKVWKASLPAVKPTGGRSELLLIRPVTPDLRIWNALARKVRPGQILVCRDGIQAEAVSQEPDGSFIFKFSAALDTAYLERSASVPLPQYILKARKRSGSDRASADDSSYQTVFASESGSIAAPTAGFHFTAGLLDELRARGIKIVYVTLHIGWGTFRPVRCEEPRDHVMLREECSISAETAAVLAAAKKSGGRIVAVGTSSMRTLETFSDDKGVVAAGSGQAELFIYPGYKFKTADVFCTNLHVPSSAPLYMTAAFAGKELLFKAYSQAVADKYRFYSYGDAMMIS